MFYQTIIVTVASASDETVACFEAAKSILLTPMLSLGDALRVSALLGQTLDLPGTIELKQYLLDPLRCLASFLLERAVL